MRRPLLVLCLVLLTVVACWAWARIWRPAPVLPEYGEVADFTLTNQDGQGVSRADLAGKVWVAGFAFTRCTGPCPQVTATMARLQAELANQPDFRLVSFSVDPDHDTPEVLQKYAHGFRADPQRWSFLTGPRDDVYSLVEKSFKLGVQQAPGREVTHSTRLALVDRKGRIRGYFEGRQLDDEGQPTQSLPELKQAIAALLQERS
jgi:protein SCO1/2